MCGEIVGKVKGKGQENIEVCINNEQDLERLDVNPSATKDIQLIAY